MMDSGNASVTSNLRYGRSGMSPATKYAANMITAASIEPRVSSTPPSISSTEASERKLRPARPPRDSNPRKKPDGGDKAVFHAEHQVAQKESAPQSRCLHPIIVPLLRVPQKVNSAPYQYLGLDLSIGI